MKNLACNAVIAATLLAGTAFVGTSEAASVPPPEVIAETPDIMTSQCKTRLSGGIAIFQSLPPLVGEGACGAMDAVRLEAVILNDGEHVAFSTPALLRCPMAEAVVHWVRDDVVPTMRRLGMPLKAIENYGSYECRGRNRITGARLSEHGLAGALDIRGVKLTEGRTVLLGRSVGSLDFREAMRAAACARFTTVLGPASDGYHEDHIHFDLAERTSGFRLCQWDVRDFVPLPRPRPNLEGEAISSDAAEQSTQPVSDQ